MTVDFNARLGGSARFSELQARSFQNVLPAVRVASGNKILTEPDPAKIVNDTVDWYASAYSRSFDVEATRNYAKEKMDAFVKTPSYAALSEENREKMLKLFAEMCVSYKSERNPGPSNSPDLRRSSQFTQDTRGIRTYMGEAIDALANGTVKFEFGFPDLKEKFDEMKTNPNSCKIDENLTAEQYEQNIKATGIGAMAVPDFKAPGTGTIYFGDLMPWDGTHATTDVAATTHEIIHILFEKKRQSLKCIDSIGSEYNSYMLESVYTLGDGYGRAAAFNVGMAMEEFYINNPNSPYHIAYKNLSEKQQKVFQELVAELKGPKTPQGYTGGYLMPTEEFERRLKEAGE